MEGNWFQGSEPVEHEIVDPSTGAKATVWMRPLTWGDMAEINELRLAQRLDGGSDVRLSPGENKLIMVEKAVVRWTLPAPITRDTLRALNPKVGEELFRLVDAGEGPTPKPDDKPAETPALTIEGTATRTNGAEREDDAVPPTPTASEAVAAASS